MAIITIVSALCRPPTPPTKQPGASIDGMGVRLDSGGVGAALVASNSAVSAVFPPNVPGFNASLLPLSAHVCPNPIASTPKQAHIRNSVHMDRRFGPPLQWLWPDFMPYATTHPANLGFWCIRRAQIHGFDGVTPPHGRLCQSKTFIQQSTGRGE